MPRLVPKKPPALAGLAWCIHHHDKLEKLNDEQLHILCRMLNLSDDKKWFVYSYIEASLSEADIQISKDLTNKIKRIKTLHKTVEHFRNQAMIQVNELVGGHEISPIDSREVSTGIIEQIEVEHELTTATNRTIKMLSLIDSDEAQEKINDLFLAGPFTSLENDLLVLETMLAEYLSVVESHKTPRERRNSKKNDVQQCVWALANAYYWITSTKPDVKFPKYEGDANQGELVGSGAKFITYLLDLWGIKRAKSSIYADLQSQSNRAWE